jgi:hypothetical protein
MQTERHGFFDQLINAGREAGELETPDFPISKLSDFYWLPVSSVVC